MDIRSRHEDLRRLISETQGSTPKIDFDYYRGKLPAKEYGGMVTELEDKVKAFQPTKIDLTAQLEQLTTQKAAKVIYGCLLTCRVRCKKLRIF
jgi:hypothetical protein